MSMKKYEKLHYAWVILGCSILMAIAGFGVVGNVGGNFITPVVREFGTSVSSFTMFTSIEAAAMAILYIPAGKILTSKKIGHVMGWAFVLEFVAIGLMGTYRSVPFFYFSGMLLGIGAAFSRYTAIPILINMWFKEKAGFALGLTMSLGSVGTIVFNFLSAWFIESFGWRNAYFLLAVIGALITVPFVFTLVKSPQEKEILPYGAQEETEIKSTAEKPEWGLTRNEAFRSPVFYLAWATCLCFSIGSCMGGYVANFTTMELGKSISYGATASVVVTIGGVLCSSILGMLNDRYGVKAGLLWGVVFSVGGMLLMIVSIQAPGVLLPAAMIMGLGGSLYTVQAPLIARSTLGGREYAAIWTVMMTGNSLAGAFSYSPMGLIYDRTGSYKGAFLICMSMYLLSLVLGWIAVSQGKKMQQQAK